MVATQEQIHKMLYGAGGGRPARGVGGGEAVLPKWYKD